jgi:hypothetical protein
MSIPRVTANISRPADATQYAAGDAISNSATASAVLPLTFYVPYRAGTLYGCTAVVTPASASLVITALDFTLLLFRPAPGIPFAAGAFGADNVAMDITAAAAREFVCSFAFTNAAWRNPAGALTAGATGYQSAVPNNSRPRVPFNLAGDASTTNQTQALIGVLQANAAWNPTGIVNRFDFSLDMELDA